MILGAESSIKFNGNNLIINPNLIEMDEASEKNLTIKKKNGNIIMSDEAVDIIYNTTKLHISTEGIDINGNLSIKDLTINGQSLEEYVKSLIK